jgi:hypothetical protein
LEWEGNQGKEKLVKGPSWKKMIARWKPPGSKKWNFQAVFDSRIL